MDTPVRIGDVARMVAAQLCFIGATGPAVVAGMLVRDRFDADIVVAIGVMMSVSAGATGIGVTLLSRRARDGFLAAFALTIALCFALYFVKLMWSFFDWNVG